MYENNQYKDYLKKHYYNRIKKQIMDNKEIEKDIKKQIEEITIIFNFGGVKMSEGDRETIKMIAKDLILFKNKVREKLNIEIYLKSLFTTVGEDKIK